MNNQQNKEKENQQNKKPLQKIDINSLQQAEIQKRPPEKMTAPPSAPTPNPTQSTTPSNTTIPFSSSSPAPLPPQANYNQDNDQYILSVKRIILNFLDAFQEGTLTFTEKNKQKKDIQHVFIINKKKINLQLKKGKETSTHTYHISTGQYLENNREKGFDEMQTFIQTILQPTFKWIADDHAVYVLKRTPR
jgi:hypothetical protein